MDPGEAPCSLCGKTSTTPNLVSLRGAAATVSTEAGVPVVWSSRGESDRATSSTERTGSRLHGRSEGLGVWSLEDQGHLRQEVQRVEWGTRDGLGPVLRIRQAEWRGRDGALEGEQEEGE